MSIFTKPIHFFLIIFIALTFCELGVIFYLNLFKTFDQRQVSSNPNFQYADTLTCNVVYSTHSRNRGPFLNYLEEKNFTLSKLTTNTPEISSYPLIKISEGEDYITVQSNPSTDSIETISLLKDKGTFVRSVFGRTGLYGNSEFQYVVAQKGSCE